MTVKIAGAAPPKPVVSPKQTEKQTVMLELAFYKNYRRNNVPYTKGTVYKFSPEQALILLREQDAGRRIWKRVTTLRVAPPKPIVAAERVNNRVVVDATAEPVTVNKDEFGEPEKTEELPAIELGNDEEIADILNEVEGDDSEDEIEQV